MPNCELVTSMMQHSYYENFDDFFMLICVFQWIPMNRNTPSFWSHPSRLGAWAFELV
jgi:hypothetical protein